MNRRNLLAILFTPLIGKLKPSVAPRDAVYGRCRVGGTVVYQIDPSGIDPVAMERRTREGIRAAHDTAIGTSMAART